MNDLVSGLYLTDLAKQNEWNVKNGFWELECPRNEIVFSQNVKILRIVLYNLNLAFSYFNNKYMSS